MKNKCPNCGYEYNDNDAFCAMCGVKLDKNEEDLNGDNLNNADNNELLDSKNSTIDNIKQFIDENKDKNTQDKPKLNFKSFNSGLFNFIVIMVVISLIMSFSLYTIIRKQETNKNKMQYNNMIANPALIPQLKEPKSFYELRTNLYSCENFLHMYLAYSKDSDEKKEQVFISYLKEMEKLPHITSENMVNDDLDSCSVIKTQSKAKKCSKQFSNDFKNVGIKAYSDHNVVYLYPDYKFIYKKYSYYLSNDMNKFLKLKAKYNTPVRVGLELQVKPKVIADKIYDFEKLYTVISDVYIRDEILKTIYNDLRTFIFTPSIYATTTQEMKRGFKTAYNYFINNKKKSQLRPVIMSYMDKMRSYDETNFKNDYPYKIFEDTFDENVKNSSLADIFVQLRKNLFANNSQTIFAYTYTLSTSSWNIYDKTKQPYQGQYMFSVLDENNNISIYDNKFSLIQELNIPRYSRLFISNSSLYCFNSDRLSLSKIVFNGRSFSLQQLNISDINSVFPGIRVINIDSYQNYNIYIDKDSEQCAYIILSRYSQGFDGYKLSALKGAFMPQGLPNMFTISTSQPVEISFHHNKINPNETSDNNPTYKIIIRTNISSNTDGVVKYDEQTAQENIGEVHNPNIMPKIIKDEIKEDATENLTVPPRQNINPDDEY